MYSIREVCERTGLTAHTLRYYEKQKLLPNVRRSAGGFRQYSEADMEALKVICCLKNTGMALQDISRFMELTRAGDHTLRERCELLKKHRDAVVAGMEEMQRHLDRVTWKVQYFTERLSEYEQKERDAD